MVKFFRPEKKSLLQSNDPTEPVTIERLNDDGRGVTKTGKGKTTFVHNALVGEQVSIKLIKEHSRYIEAETREIITPSPLRAQPKCKYYHQCGGCSLQHMTTEAQRQFKQQRVLLQLQHWAKIQPEETTEIVSNHVYSYRQRIRLGVVANKSKVSIGFRKKNSKQLIDIDHCPVMLEELSCLIQPLKQWLREDITAVTHIELIDSDQTIGLIIRHTRQITTKKRQRLQSLIKINNQENKKAISCWLQGSKHEELELLTGESLSPRMFYTLHDYGIRLYFHPQDFVQANSSVNQQMVKQAITWLKPAKNETFLDLFCGVGNFTLAIAQFAQQVLGVEVISRMVNRAQQNAHYNQCLNAYFKEVDLSLSGSIDQLPKVDGLLLDPPRSGAKIICEGISKLNPKRIVYISCDTATFSRDAQLLDEQGYRLLTLSTMDMFPQTPHSEVMGLFVK